MKLRQVLRSAAIVTLLTAGSVAIGAPAQAAVPGCFTYWETPGSFPNNDVYGGRNDCSYGFSVNFDIGGATDSGCLYYSPGTIRTFSRNWASSLSSVDTC